MTAKNTSLGPLVGLVLGSVSDGALAKEICSVLARLKIPYEVTVASAHRTPDKAISYARKAADRDLKVIIGVAGLAAHLPGVLAAHTLLPVIGVPVAAGTLGGFDALLSIVQMPGGVPVASVGIDNARNAALLAASILALSDAGLTARLDAYRSKMTADVKAGEQILQQEIRGLHVDA